MEKEKVEIKMGMEVRDKVTGFKGIVTSIAKYLSGCDRVLISPPVDKEGKIMDSEHFDITEVEFVANGLYVPPVPKRAATGGPRRFPGRSR